MHQNDIFLEEYNKLNAKQKQAVDTIEGPVMVVAGPGTGKTQIIASRCANIILKTGVNPNNIFITTFTEAGVIAIKERLQKFIGKESYKVYVSTIHSFAQDVISSFPEKFSEEKTGTPLDEIDSLEIIKEILQKHIDTGSIQELRTSGDTFFYLRDVKSTIDKLKQEAISPQKLALLTSEQRDIYIQALDDLKTNKRIRDLEKRTQKDKEKYDAHIGKLEELYLIYHEYQKTLLSQERYDYNDMIQFVLNKFQTDEDLRYYYAEKFQYIMLDEYQDTNNAQNEIISQILSVSIDAPNIMVVGDDDQSIYRFQGANIENMLEFHQEYPGVKTIVLEENYRSRQEILDTSSTLIENNTQRLAGRIQGLEKILSSAHPRFEKLEKKEPRFVVTNTDIVEKIFVVKEIQSLLEGGVAAQEIAIIVRGNREVEAWTDFLNSQGIENQSKMKTNILGSIYVNFILDYLAIISDPYSNEEKCINILRSKIIDVENIDIIRINRGLYNENYKRSEKLKLFDVLFQDIYLQKIEIQNREKLEKFKKQFISFTEKLATSSFLDFFDTFLREIGIIEYVEKNGTFDDLQDIYTLFHTIKSFLQTRKNFTIKHFLSKIELYKTFGVIISRNELQRNISGVQIMTAHSSKGLEYEAVFIPGLYTGNWDNKKVIEKIQFPAGIVKQVESGDQKETNIEEERRLFFVALTRAKNHLVLTCPMSIEGKLKIASEFIEEIRGNIHFEQAPMYDEMTLSKVIRSIMTPADIFRHSPTELLYIEEFLKNYRLSPSDLNVFLENPRDFLHRVVFKYPFIDNEATIFGSVYHEVLEIFYKEQKKTGQWPTFEFMKNKFIHILLKQTLTDIEYQRLEKKGIDGLKGYYDTYVGNFQIPFFVEYDFRPKRVFFEGIPLTGKIDKIVRMSNSEPALFQKEEVAIVDYKTGAIKYRGDIKGIDKDGNAFAGYEKGKYFRQLLFYKLLCEADYDFSQNYEVKKLYLDFAEGREGKYKIEDVEYTDEEYNNFKSLLRESAKKIYDMEYWKHLLLSELGQI